MGIVSLEGNADDFQKCLNEYLKYTSKSAREAVRKQASKMLFYGGKHVKKTNKRAIPDFTDGSYSSVKMIGYLLAKRNAEKAMLHKKVYRYGNKKVVAKYMRFYSRAQARTFAKKQTNIRRSHVGFASKWFYQIARLLQKKGGASKKIKAQTRFRELDATQTGVVGYGISLASLYVFRAKTEALKNTDMDTKKLQRNINRVLQLGEREAVADMKIYLLKKQRENAFIAGF